MFLKSSIFYLLIYDVSRPVYGLIFLYKWKEDDASQQETTCPPNVWFANQVSVLELLFNTFIEIINYRLSAMRVLVLHSSTS